MSLIDAQKNEFLKTKPKQQKNVTKTVHATVVQLPNLIKPSNRGFLLHYVSKSLA